MTSATSFGAVEKVTTDGYGVTARTNFAIICSAFNLDVASNGLLIGATKVTASLTITTSASTA